MQELAFPIDHLPPYLSHAEHSNSVLVLIGDPGIGKTEIVEAAARKMGRLCCTKILAAMGVEDIALAGPTPGSPFINFLANEGFPFVGTEKRWLHPSTGKAPILFLDEITNTIPYLQNAFLQGLSERSIHGIPFIPGTIIIAAGNRAGTNHTSRLSFAFCNRMNWLYLLPPTIEGFSTYCTQHNVNEFISAYHVNTGGERLYVFDPDKFLVEPASPTPRVWVRGVGPILDNTNLSDAERMVLIGGAIGFGQAQDFEMFYRLRKELPNLDAILLGSDAPIPKNVSTKVLVINALVRRTTHQNVHHVFKYISKLASVDPEYADLFEKNLFIKDPTFAGNPAYTRWVVASNRKPIQNAAATPSLPEPPAGLAEPDPQQPTVPTVSDILNSLPPAVLLPKPRRI